MIDLGADVSPVDRWGGTPLDDALRGGHDRVADFLKKRGGVHGSTPRKKAAGQSKSSACVLL